MPNSSRAPAARKAKTDKPAKPYDGFPLYPHPLGYWSKKVNGKILHFGRWGRVKQGKMVREPDDGWQAALNTYQDQRDDAYAGRPVGSKVTTGLTVRELCNAFWQAKKHLLASGEIHPRTFAEYESCTDRIVEAFGKDRKVDS